MGCSLFLVTAEGCLQPDRTVETGLGAADSQGANDALDSSLGTSCRGSSKNLRAVNACPTKTGHSTRDKRSRLPGCPNGGPALSGHQNGHHIPAFSLDLLNSLSHAPLFSVTVTELVIFTL